MIDDSAQPSADEGLRRHLRIIGDFGKLALRPESGLPELLQAAVRAASEGARVDKTKMLLYHPERDDLEIVAGVGWSPGVLGMHVSAHDRSPAGKALRSAAPVVVDDLPNDPAYDYLDPMRSHGIVSVCNVPVRINGQPVGVLEIDSDQPLRLGDDAIHFLTGLAQFVAAAIQSINAMAAARSAAAAAAVAAAQREVLHAELEHRVANSLQSIQAAVHLERRRATDEAAREVAQRLLQRVEAAVGTHRQLDENQQDARQVPIRPFLQSLCARLDPGGRVGVRLAVADLLMPLHQAVTIGRLINEIVVNSLKHAFPHGDAGQVEVTLAADEQRRTCTLVVSDSGPGMGPARPGGRGLGLIAALANQLRATVEQDQTPGSGGTRYTIMFSLDAARPDATEPGVSHPDAARPDAG